jgi:CRISPR-associated protein Csb3
VAWSGGVVSRCGFLVAMPGESGKDALVHLVKELARCEISGLSDADRQERKELERQRRDSKKKGEEVSAEQQKRLAELGSKAREGEIRIGKPFDLLLDWWDAGGDGAAPKTWAGQQELHKVARAAQDALFQINDVITLLDYGCVLRMPKEYAKGKADLKKPVEPFYFDARRFAHRLDVGFSLDALELETVAHPAVELLALLGLQRFRPSAKGNDKWIFDYWTWSTPLSAPVAAPVFSGVSDVPQRRGYRFHLLFRDDQKRYKAFGPSTLFGGEA